MITVQNSKDLRALSWVSLGGNEGQVRENFEMAKDALRTIAMGNLLSSKLYESEPWGLTEQAVFLNQIVGFQAICDAHEALDYVLEIERALGRERITKWGPRPLDIDLLSWPGQVCTTAKLTLPHPNLAMRRFILVPWEEIAPNLIPNGLDVSVRTLLSMCSDSSWVRLAEEN